MTIMHDNTERVICFEHGRVWIELSIEGYGVRNYIRVKTGGLFSSIQDLKDLRRATSQAIKWCEENQDERN